MAGYYEEMGWSPPENAINDMFIQMTGSLRELELILDNWDMVPPPASNHAVAQLPESISGEANLKKQCSICLITYELGDCLKTMPCKHFFHRDCLVPWLQKRNSCPCCRYELPTDSKEYEEYKKSKQEAERRQHNVETLHQNMFS